MATKTDPPFPLRFFFLIWSGQAFSLLGSQLVQFALIWHLTQETGSATVLALASLAGLLPATVLGPLAGVLVDRWNRRWVMAGADAVVALATVLLAVLFASGRVEIWHIYAIMFVRALGGAFHNPAMQASTSLMVPEAHLTRIAGLNQMLSGGLNIVSAPLGALLLAWLPMQGILAIDVGTALFAILPLLFIAIPQPRAAARPPAGDDLTTPVTSLLGELADGFRYVWGWPGLRVLVFIAVTINLLMSPAFSLMPLLVTDHFGGDALQLGWLESAFGVGVLAGGLLLSVWGGFRRRMVTSQAGILLLGASVLALGFTPATLFLMALVVMGLTGVAIPLTNGPIHATIQVAVAPEMQGRVFTLLNSLASGMAPVGLLVAGPVADLVGVRVWYFAAGGASLLLALMGLTNQALLNLDRARPGTAAPVPEAEAIA